MSFAQEQIVWKKARLKVAWRYHVYLSLVIIAVCWLVWFFSDAANAGIPWPILVMCVWLIILLLHFIVYKMRLHQLKLVLREIEKGRVE
jgi:ABC-type xylose transport system permease subunit